MSWGRRARQTFHQFARGLPAHGRSLAVGGSVAAGGCSGSLLARCQPERASGSSTHIGSDFDWRSPPRVRVSAPVAGQATDVLGAIGNTPLVEIKSLSKATGCRILAKCEHMNPGGSVKDRAALWLVETAERNGLLKPGDTIVEGTGGNTGIGLALVANAKGYKTILAMPETLVAEKIDYMRTLGAEVILTPPCPFSDPRHYFHVAAGIAAERPDSVFFTNQFENLACSRAHFESTAPEIWAQTAGKVDGFVCAPGTGGTIGGVSTFLKKVNPSCSCWVIDPDGSAIFGYVSHGEKVVTRAPSPSSGRTIYEGDKLTRYIPRSTGSSISEGIGIDRVTANFSLSDGLLDGCFSGSDFEIVQMAYHLLEHDGVFVGPSAALNVVGAVKLARVLGPGHNVVTVLCDSGERYRSKLFNKAWLKTKELLPAASAEATARLEFVRN